MVNESAAASPSKLPPQSPWKKPKVSLLKASKSIKRKPDLFNLNSINRSLSSDNNNYSNQDFDNQSPLTKKSVFNRFSVNNNTNASNLSNSKTSDLGDDFGSTPNNHSSKEKNDLYSFFNSRKTNPDEVNEDFHSPKITLSSDLVKNLYASLTSNLLNTDLSAKKEKQNDEETRTKFRFEHEKLIPIDWSLKTKLRVVSTKPFACYNGIKSQHESEALINYSKFNSFYQNLNEHSYKSAEEKQDLFKTLFGESISYWAFPYLPWLNLYPRNAVFSNISTEPLGPDIQKALSKSWNSSFKSLYNSLKSNQCPYFYVLTHSFMVLFRAESLSGDAANGEMCAILTPSTKGLRQSLQDISFTMPLAPNFKKSESCDFRNMNENTSDTQDNLNTIENAAGSCGGNESLTSEKENSSNSNEKKEIEHKVTNSEDEENDDEDDCEEPDEWLEQIGLNSAVNFKASVLQRNTKNLQKDSLYNFDNRPRSTLFFSQSSDVQALFNFLLNSKSCVNSSGPLSGVPPTLLAPIAFVGATLQKNRVEQKVIKTLNKQGNPITQYAIDLIGPVMPYHVHRLCNLFSVTQSGEFEMIANVYDQSQALNCARKLSGQENASLGADSTESSNDSNTNLAKKIKIASSYLDSSEARSLENEHGLFGESATIKTIFFKENKFCCNC